jgi:hypothetical protein
VALQTLFTRIATDERSVGELPPNPSTRACVAVPVGVEAEMGSAAAVKLV